MLKVLSSSLKQRVCSTSNDTELYADLEGYRYENSPPTTIPSTILVTPLRPDLVILNNPSKNIHILELTVPTNTTQGIQNARTRKQSKEAYLSLIEDISSCKWSVTYDTIEIGSLGHYTSDSVNAVKNCLTQFHSDSVPLNLKSTALNILISASKVAISCSRTIFLAHRITSWNSNRELL